MPVKKIKLSESEQVQAFLKELNYPLKNVLDRLRELIITASDKLHERIKWNAPSYYTDTDLLTFNLRSHDFVMIVFHHVSIVQIKNDNLKGDYKDRRLMYFHNMLEVNDKSEMLQGIIREYVKLSEAQ